MESFEFMEVLKILNGMNRFDWERVVGVNEWGCPEEMDEIWNTRRVSGLVHGLCLLDSLNQEKMLRHAKETMAEYDDPYRDRTSRVQACISKALECINSRSGDVT